MLVFRLVQRKVGTIVPVFPEVQTAGDAQGPHETEDVAFVQGCDLITGILARIDVVHQAYAVWKK